MRNFPYTRVFCDEEGDSHFERLTATMRSSEFSPPAAPLEVAPLGDASTLALVGGSADWDGDTPHPTPARQFMFVLSGRGEVTTSDGEIFEFGPGSALLLEDTWGKGHASRFLADEVIIAAVRLAG